MKQVNVTLPRDYFGNDEEITSTGSFLADTLQMIAKFWGDIYSRDTIDFVFYTDTPSQIIDTLRQRQDCESLLNAMVISVNEDGNDSWQVAWPPPAAKST